MIAKFESAFTPCVEIGWRFKKSFWGNGFATEAAQACLEFGFSTLGFTTVHSLTSVHIKKSKAVLWGKRRALIDRLSHKVVWASVNWWGTRSGQWA
jgi:hypothetical protein